MIIPIKPIIDLIKRLFGKGPPFCQHHWIELDRQGVRWQCCKCGKRRGFV